MAATQDLVFRFIGKSTGVTSHLAAYEKLARGVADALKEARLDLAAADIEAIEQDSATSTG